MRASATRPSSSSLPPKASAWTCQQITRKLQQLGQSVLVAGDHRAVKIHVHNERPDEVLAYGLSLGTLSRINVENLDRQATQVRDRVAAADAAAA